MGSPAEPFLVFPMNTAVEVPALSMGLTPLDTSSIYTPGYDTETAILLVSFKEDKL